MWEGGKARAAGAMMAMGAEVSRRSSDGGKNFILLYLWLLLCSLGSLVGMVWLKGHDP